GYLPDDHPLFVGVFGFAGHPEASELIVEGDDQALLIVGSSLGETATNNYNVNLTKGRYTIQLDFDQTVFNRKYQIDLPILGDIHLSLLMIIEELRILGTTRKEVARKRAFVAEEVQDDKKEYNTRNVLMNLQKLLPASTRYMVDIGEFMSYVIHHM